MNPFDIQKIRADFPILDREVYGNKLVYLDNAATAQKPQVVIDAIVDYYTWNNSNIHRGVHYLSQIATSAYEDARETIRAYINAKEKYEVIFTKGTTDAINLLAYSFGEKYIHAGDEIIVSALEHHSNLVPWQILCQRKQAKLKIVPVNDKGEFIFEEFEKLLSSKTKLVAVAHISNALGSINPIKKIIKKAHERNIPVMIDGAQGIVHSAVDVQELDCDFYAFSGHKLYAPMGVGVLYGKEQYLEEMPPYQMGGEMVDQVSYQHTTYNRLPFKFEAGTPNVEAVLGLNAAINYIKGIGIEQIYRHENELLKYATNKLKKIEGIRIIGEADQKAGVVSFLIGEIHPYDAGTIIDHFGIAIRTGHHCAQPIIDHFKIPGTIRASFAMYNNFDEIDLLINAVKQVKKMFE
ncbi:MAG: cysteine desulfurase CsdA [Bacteroidetes bacterium HGW-Bacteroidetes-17]|jgi:cysteine desulfurase/selenocysteine lyase|nr:MAG: cysteine desulfurase CsdA [Bacteroidetes bacterium HGW-Bacteroidetes-17]